MCGAKKIERLYGTRSQGLSQFYLHTRVHVFAFPAEAGPHLPTERGKAELARVAGYIQKCSASGIEPGHGHPSQY